ncbi:hypothetical protein B0H13DRAFT_2672743 [Mycena leptocephala]|nr:hypothetical protein B0H13DRAFT_2672743 [Mycena leptocephala]
MHPFAAHFGKTTVFTCLTRLLLRLPHFFTAGPPPPLRPYRVPDAISPSSFVSHHCLYDTPPFVLVSDEFLYLLLYTKADCGLETPPVFTLLNSASHSDLPPSRRWSSSPAVATPNTPTRTPTPFGSMPRRDTSTSLRLCPYYLYYYTGANSSPISCIDSLFAKIPRPARSNLYHHIVS